MFRKLMKRKRLSVLGIVAVLAVAGAAFAYWTTTGSGTGSGTVKSSNGTIALSGTIAPGLTPGGNEAVSFTATNSGSSNLQVRTIHAVVSIGEPNAKEGCQASDFSVADTVEGQTILANKTEALTNPGSIVMEDNTTANQDACKGAQVKLALTEVP